MTVIAVVLLAALVCAWAAWYVTRALRIATQLRGQSSVSEPCVGEAAAPAGTPRAIVARMLKGRRCAFCQASIEQVAFLDHYPALLQPDGTTIAWPDVPLERLADSLRTQRPVCWNCHVAETFRRRYPDLVTDRPWTRA